MKIDINLNVGNLDKKLNKKKLGFGYKLNLYTANQVAKRCDKYVPFDTGMLAKNVEVDADNDRGVIHYLQGYAYYPYKPVYDETIGVGKWHFHLDHHPLATSHWDKVMLENERDMLVNDIRKERERLANEEK